MVFDPYSSLDPSSRATSVSPHGRSAGRSRMRIGVGAAVVLLLAALGVAVAVTAVGQVGHSVEVAGNTAAAPGGDGSGTAVPTASSSDASAAPPDNTGEAPIIFVHVLGAVAHPGLFEVADGARVVDVVAAAGGLLPTADQSGVNLARLVTDGEQFYVPAQGEVVTAPPAGTAGAAGGPETAAGGAGAEVTAKVNLNTATIADLDTLPRIGPAMAQRILDYRAAEGRFASIDDLRNVTGIGEKTFAALKDLIAV
ncbi:ComEA family DNA-binding protein [Cryobacterium sp. AP23]